MATLLRSSYISFFEAPLGRKDEPMKNLRMLLSMLVCLVTVPAFASTMYFDFGETAQQTAGNYNNVTQAQLPIFNALDSTGAGTGIGLATSGFNPGSNQNGTLTPGGGALIFDPQATRDNLFGHTVNFNQPAPFPLGVLDFTGLDPSMAYDFTFFASRLGVTDNRETQYTVMGSNSDVGLLDAANDTDNVVTVPGILPTAAGTITVHVEAGPNNNNSSGFTYLGALRLTCSVPEPATGALLMLGFSGLIACRGIFANRRLS